MNNRPPQRDGIEPAAAPASTRDRAELVTDPGQMFTEFVEELGGERPCTDARRVGLHDTQHLVQSPRTNPRAAGSSAVFDEVTKG